MFLRKSNSSKADSFPTIQQLPDSFAQSVIDLETAIDFNCTLEMVKTLLELYTVIYIQQAIEYYESVQDPKYLHYQERMQNLLVRSEVMRLLKEPQNNGNSQQTTDDAIQKRKREVEINNRIRSQRMNIQLFNNISEQRDAEQAIKQQLTESKSMTSRITQNLRSQWDSFNAKLSRRRISRQMSASRPVSPTQSPGPSKRFNSSFSHNSEDESDRSGGLPIHHSLEQFEEQLEKLMEDFVENKLRVIGDIKSKYLLQIEEVKEMGDSHIIEQLLEQLNKNMQQEISDTVKELEKERKQKVLQLRTSLL